MIAMVCRPIVVVGGGQIINKAIEASEVPRGHLIHLLKMLAREGKIYRDDLNREVYQVVEAIPDLEADVPFIYENLAEVVAPLIRPEDGRVEGYIHYQDFERQVRDILPEGDPKNELLFLR